MAITREQAIELGARHAAEFHYGSCSETTGPRGGVKLTQTRVRVSGRCQTWKTRPEDFRLPFKHGLYTNGAVTPANASEFHTAADCPVDGAR